MTLEEMKARKKELGLSNKEIANRSGVPLGTVQKIFGGVTAAPRMETIIALEKILRAGNNQETQYKVLMSDMRETQYAAESRAAYKSASQGTFRKKGGYTLDDYYALPEERRVELIDGVIYDMSSPSCDHQLISGELSYQLKDFVKKNKGTCRVFTAPFDVQLDMDNRTMVQPDVMILCEGTKVNRRGVYGAPDMVIEILSPSTAKKDATLKLYKYMKAGVREYWIVDPENRQIYVYVKKADQVRIQSYSFDDLVPVGIWEDRCRVDFPEIARQLSEWPAAGPEQTDEAGFF